MVTPPEIVLPPESTAPAGKEILPGNSTPDTAAAPPAGLAGVTGPAADTPAAAAAHPQATHPQATQPPATHPADAQPPATHPAGAQPPAVQAELLPLLLPATLRPPPRAPSLPARQRRFAGLAAPQPRPPAGPAPHDVLARLSADPRLRMWLVRAAACVAVGVVLAVVTDWRIGFTAAVLVAIGDTLFRARTSAVIPARVRLTSAQRKTRRRLARLAPSGYLALHSRHIPGTTAAIDHLVIGPAGVFAVDSERWDRRLPVRASHGGNLYHGPYPQADRLREARWEAELASELIGAELGEPVRIRPAMVIYGPSVPWDVVRIAGVDVFCGRRLRKYLRRETAASRAHRLDERQIELVHAAAARVLPPVR
jgi:Nuclease-related domain